MAHRLVVFQEMAHRVGSCEKIYRAIGERLGVRLGRDPQPSAGVVDSQSVKSTAVGVEDRGFDGAKKVNGRKRHLLVDTAKASCSQSQGPQRRQGHGLTEGIPWRYCEGRIGDCLAFLSCAKG